MAVAAMRAAGWALPGAPEVPCPSELTTSATTMTTAPAPAPIAAITARRLPPPGRECLAGRSPCPPDPAGGGSLTVVAATAAAAPGDTLLIPACLGPGSPTCWAPVLC